MSGVQFSLQQLDAALLDLYDLMSRVLLQNEFFVMGEAGRCLREQRGLDCNVIEIGIEARHIIPEVKSTLKDWVKGDVTDEGFTHEYQGVPVKVTFITELHDYLKYPDMRFYGPEQYKIPNTSYWL